MFVIVVSIHLVFSKNTESQSTRKTDYLTEYEVCIGKHFSEVFVQEKAFCEKNPEAIYFLIQIEQARLIRNFSYGFSCSSPICR